MAKRKPATAEIIDTNSQIKKEISIAADAAIGVIGVRCAASEVFRVLDVIREVTISREVGFKTWMMGKGWCEYEKTIDDEIGFRPFSPVSTDKTAAGIIPAFAKIMENADNTPSGVGGETDDNFYVMIDAHHFFEDGAVHSALRNQADRAESNDQRLFIIIPDYVAIPDAIAPLMHLIDFELPSAEELSNSFVELLGNINEDQRPHYEQDEIDVIIKNGLGMTKSAFDTAVSWAIIEYTQREDDGDASDMPFGHILSHVREYKTSMLRKTNVLELMTEIPMDNVGGLEHYKNWINTRKTSFTEGAIKFGITPSRGCLIVGSPGTGKSLIAKGTGHTLGLPVIRLDVGRIFNAFIGTSEQTMRTVLKLVDAMSPCVLFVDEIDKGFGGIGGGTSDSGTTMRVFGTFLTWLQERDQKKRPVFVIFTANKVVGLPPELMRRGRIDEIWGVSIPSKVERIEILKIHAKLRGHKLAKDEFITAADMTRNLVGAEIESLIENALNLDLAAGNDGLTLASIEVEIGNLKPMYRTFASQIAEMEAWSKENARPASEVEEEIESPQRTSGVPRRALKLKRK